MFIWYPLYFMHATITFISQLGQWIIIKKRQISHSSMYITNIVENHRHILYTE